MLCVFPPASPPTVPNPENVFDGAIKTGVQFMYTVPAFIEVSVPVLPGRVHFLWSANALCSYGCAIPRRSPL